MFERKIKTTVSGTEKLKPHARICIKHSDSATEAPTLNPGEMAYSWADGIDKLWIGTTRKNPIGLTLNETVVIGGAYYTKIVDAIKNAFTFDDDGNITAINVDIFSASGAIEIDDVIKSNGVVISADDDSESSASISAKKETNGTTSLIIDADKTVIPNLFISSTDGTEVSLIDYLYTNVPIVINNFFKDNLDKDFLNEIVSEEDGKKVFGSSLKVPSITVNSFGQVVNAEEYDLDIGGGNLSVAGALNVNENAEIKFTSTQTEGEETSQKSLEIATAEDKSSVVFAGESEIKDTVISGVTITGETSSNSSEEGVTTTVKTTNINGVVIENTATENADGETTSSTIISTDVLNVNTVSTPISVGSDDEKNSSINISSSAESVVEEGSVATDDTIIQVSMENTGSLNAMLVKGSLDVQDSLIVDKSLIVSENIVAYSSDEDSKPSAVIAGFVLDGGSF